MMSCVSLYIVSIFFNQEVSSELLIICSSCMQQRLQSSSTLSLMVLTLCGCYVPGEFLFSLNLNPSPWQYLTPFKQLYAPVCYYCYLFHQLPCFYSVFIQIPLTQQTSVIVFKKTGVQPCLYSPSLMLWSLMAQNCIHSLSVYSLQLRVVQSSVPNLSGVYIYHTLHNYFAYQYYGLVYITSTAGA